VRRKRRLRRRADEDSVGYEGFSVIAGLANDLEGELGRAAALE
jgi:hypothetical protein